MKGFSMNRFTVGSMVGFIVGVGVAAAPAPPKQDPCEGWKADVAVLNAVIYVLCNQDDAKYTGTLKNTARYLGEAINTPPWVWETDKVSMKEKKELLGFTIGVVKAINEGVIRDIAKVKTEADGLDSNKITREPKLDA